MERSQFEELIKDALANLYDYAALEARPQLFNLLPAPPHFSGRRADYVRQFLIQAIEELRPPAKLPSRTAPEWRPYLILSRRYVDGLGLAELSAELALSERQLRRDHHRALSALLNRLWEQFAPKVDETSLFEPNSEAVDLHATLQSVLTMLAPHLHDSDSLLHCNLCAQALHVQTDRVVLRQVLINLIRAALERNTAEALQLRTERTPPHAVLELSGLQLNGEQHALPPDLYHWCERIQARLETSQAEEAFCLRLSLPLSGPGTPCVLVIDDQEPAIQLFRRYLSRTACTVIGLSQAAQAVETAQRLRPTLITLDVMMPQLDGWEVLQALKLDPMTRSIPVLICSAWADPDLALSLGAAGFLKKPVTQKALFETLTSLGLPLD